jgi:enoyl-CoA hydratase/carnithine racemase
MSDSPVRVELKDGVARVTLDRPPLNLLRPDSIAALREAFQALARDREVRVAVITGSGRAFTAGMDVRFLLTLDAAAAKPFIAGLHSAIHAVHEAPFPVIAALNGHALGAGFELALACDLRIAAAGATLGLPEVRVGLPSVIEAALLPALVGPGRAAELLLVGEAIGAARALEWGLVNQVVEAGDLERATDAVVERIAACAPSAIRLQKELIVAWRKTDLATAVYLGINAFATAFTTGEPAEALGAFLQKRPARFSS